MSKTPAQPIASTQSEDQSVRSGTDETITTPAGAPPSLSQSVAVPAPEVAAVAGFAAPVAPGKVGSLGPYRIVKELGKGCMGAVYAAIDTRLERRLALKVMLPQYAADAGSKARFLREARAAARIKHDNVVTVYEADERDGVPYIAMEYLEGYPLDEFLKKKGPPSISQIMRIASEAAAGLSAAHAIGLVHRDIKPGNLWLEVPHGRVKVLDFGLAKPVDTEAGVTKSGAVVGTPAYMSPEQARGQKVNHRTDLFSLGVLLYRLCANRLPFEGPTTMAVLMALGTDEPRPVREHNPAVPESLATLIHQLLAKKADDRPQTADEVRNRLRAIAREMATPAESHSPQPAVVYVPIQVTALPPAANPFANINVDDDATERERTATPATEAKPTRKKPNSKTPLMFAGLAVLLAVCVVAGVIIIIKNKDGTETKIEVPDGATVTVKGKDGKTLAQVGPGGPDLKAAEYAISLGGFVRVNGADRDIQAAGDLPKERFTLTWLNLGGTKVTDAGLANFKDCKNLTHLNLSTTQVSNVGLTHFKDCNNLTHLFVQNTQVGDAGLANFKDCKNLTHVWLHDTKVSDAGLAQLKDCKNLTHIWLNNTTASDTGLANFKDCKNLTLLDLSNTQVSDAGLAQLKDCKNLTHIWLGNTRVSDAGLAQLKDCKALVYLSVEKTKVTAKGLAEFHAALPTCKIEHDGGVIEPKK